MMSSKHSESCSGHSVYYYSVSMTILCGAAIFSQFEQLTGSMAILRTQ